MVRVAAREQDGIAATYALDARVAVEPKREFALVDDMQGAEIGEAHRESRRRGVRDGILALLLETDAPEQLRKQVVRLAGGVEAGRGSLERWRDRQTPAAPGASRPASLDDRQSVPAGRSLSPRTPPATLNER